MEENENIMKNYLKNVSKPDVSTNETYYICQEEVISILNRLYLNS